MTTELVSRLRNACCGPYRDGERASRWRELRHIADRLMTEYQTCRTCFYWKRRNQTMGCCTYPLPASVREIVGTGIAEKGVYQWVDYVRGCKTWRSEMMTRRSLRILLFYTLAVAAGFVIGWLAYGWR